MNSKKQLITVIYEAFKNVKLEDGIGLWEAQGHDDRLSIKECVKLRSKDQKEDWEKIPLIHLYQCSSSLTFFDAKGLRFHFPVFLLYALGVYREQKLEVKGELKGCAEPDIDSVLVSIVAYKDDKNVILFKQLYKERFSIFNNEQLKCITKYLEYKMSELEAYYRTDEAKKIGLLPTAVQYNEEYIQLKEAITCWNNEFPI